MVSFYEKGGHVTFLSLQRLRWFCQVELMTSLWRTGLLQIRGEEVLQRMWFRRKAATTGKVEIPESATK